MDNDDQVSGRGPKFCLGSQLLARKLEEEGITPHAAERKAAAPSGIIGRLIRGDRGAGLSLAIKLRNVFGVPVEAWTEPAVADDPEAA